MIVSDAMSLSAIMVVTVCLMLLGALALSSSLVSKILRRDRKRLPGGLHVRHDPKDARFEIVAVHGLGANPEYTWTCKAESPGSGGNSRVHLLDLLAKQFPDARIMNFAHSSDWLIDASFSTVQETGITLSRQLVKRREKNPSRLPIVFIGHSFGGIVIKEALDWLANKDRWVSKEELRATNIVENTRGILFLGTPHRGSPLAPWASLLARAARVFGSEIGLLYLLSQDSGPLSDTTDRFEKIQSRLSQATIFSFYEQKKTYLGFFPTAKVVGKESARGLSDKLIPINTDHSGLNKCQASSDQVFQEISTAIETTTSLSPSLFRADRWILDRYTKDERLWIQRISGERLPMDSCYVNLNIVEQNVRGGQNIDHVHPPSLDFSLAARLRGTEQNLSDGKQIRLPALFKPRKFPNENEKRRPRRILIRGRAGVGKSTLCKKIIGDFLQLQQARKSLNDGTNDPKDAPEYSYCSHFNRVLWVPLGNLATRQDRDFWEWLLGMYFAPMKNPEAKPMVEALKDHLQSHHNENDTLFLLDGMDEIAARLQDGSVLKESVDWLIGQRNVIVTSRPSVRFDQSLERETFDMELETIGFYQNQVEDYVAKVEQLHAANILGFLKTRPLIQDLVRIPVQLDALCFAWKDAASRNMNRRFVLETMTGLYQAIEGALWRKDSYRLERTSESDTPLPSEIEKIMKTEISLLENLAFHGMCEGLTVFDEHFLDRILKELQEELQPQKGLDYTLQRLSFLRSPEVSPGQARRNYYFLHLTHQEYFAARHLKRQWVERNARGVDAIGFFREHKYSERFDIVWRFLSGLLGSHDDEIYSHSGPKIKYEYGPKSVEANQLEGYFKKIRQEPLDMLGLTHQRLVMRCLFEVPTARSLSVRGILEKQLENWLLFEYDFKSKSYRHEWLANDMEYPEHIIGRLLAVVDEDCKARLLQSLKPRHTKSADIVSLVTSWIEQKHGPVLKDSISMFETFPESSFSEKAIRTIIEKLNDVDHSVRDQAALVVRRMMRSPALSQSTLEAMMRALDFHHDSFIKTHVLDDYHAALFETDLEVVRTYIFRPSEQVLSKVARIITSLPQHAYAPKEMERQEQIQRAALYILIDEQVILPSGISDTLIRWLRQVDLVLHNDVLRILSRQPALTSQVVEKIMRNFKSGNSDSCSIAIEILKTRLVLPEATRKELIEIATQKFKSNDLGLCSIAIKVLDSLPVLPEATRMELTENAMQKFKSAHPNLRSIAIEVLSSQPLLPEAISIELLQIFMTVIKNPDLTQYHKLMQEQEVVLKILERQDRLQETVSRVLVRLISTGRSTAKECAGSILRHQSDLSGMILDMLARAFEIGDFKSQKEIGKVLKERPGLPESILQILAQGLQHESPKSQEAALQALPMKQDLPDETLGRVVDMFTRKHLKVADSAFNVLQNCHNLPQPILDRISSLLGDKDRNTRKHALKIIKNRCLSKEILSQIDLLTKDEEPCFWGIAPSDKALGQIYLLADDENPCMRSLALSSQMISQIDLLTTDEEPCIRGLALKIFLLCGDGSKRLDKIERMLGDQDPKIRELALKTFLRSKDGSKRLDKIESMLGNEDLSIREHAVETAIKNKLLAKLTDAALEQVAQTLKANTGVRFRDVLSGAKRLTPEFIRLIMGKLEDEDPKIRSGTLETLTDIETLPQVIIDAVHRKLRDSKPRVKSAAMDLACDRQDLFPLVVEILKKGSQEEDLYHRPKAIKCYLSQRSPPENLLPFVLQALNSMSDGAEFCAKALLARKDNARLDAFLIRSSENAAQSNQPMSLLELMAQNMGGDDYAIQKYLKQLWYRDFKFPLRVCNIMLQKLEYEDDYEARRYAMKFIDETDDLPEDRLYPIMTKILENDRADLAWDILRKFSRNSRLPDFVLTSIAAWIKQLHLETPYYSQSSSLSTIILKHPELATICASMGAFPGLYRFLFKQSFDDHLVWLHRSNDLDHSSGQYEWCFQTMGEDVKKELVKARRNILGPELASEDGT